MSRGLSIFLVAGLLAGCAPLSQQFPATFEMTCVYGIASDGATTGTATLTYTGIKPYLVDLSTTASVTREGGMICASANQGNKKKTLLGLGSIIGAAIGAAATHGSTEGAVAGAAGGSVIEEGVGMAVK